MENYEQHALSRKDLGFLLKKPCADCPFKKSTPFHDGVGSSLPDLYEGVEKGLITHTCHKTDPRSDGYEDNYNGQVQQCAGFIVMLKKMEAFNEEDLDKFHRGLLSSYLREDFAPSSYPDDKDVFSSVKEMARHYLPFLRGKRRRRMLTDDGAVIHVSYNSDTPEGWDKLFKEEEDTDYEDDIR